MISEKTYKIITNNADVSSLVFVGCVKGRWVVSTYENEEVLIFAYF